MHDERARERETVRALVMRHGWNATAYQLLNPGITWWISAEHDAVVGYVSAAGTRVVAGAPVCSIERLGDVVDAFDADAHLHGERVCYFGAGRRLEEILLPLGRWSAASLGAQPSWDPARWGEIVAHKQSLRAQLSRARNKGVVVTRWDAERAQQSEALRACLEQWLGSRGLPPLHFLVEPDTLDNLRDRRVFVAERAGKVVGFVVTSPVPAREGWLVEQIIRGHGAVNGTAELLLDTAMRALAEEGARYVTLGLAPLSLHSRFDVQRMPAWLRVVLRMTRAHGRRFYNFEGLDAFKAKFEPGEWEEIVALADSTPFPPRALWSIASAFARGSPVWLVLRAVWRGARQELRWAARRMSVRS